MAKKKALAKRGTASKQDEATAKRKQFLAAVAAQAMTVRAALAHPASNPASIEDCKVAAVDAVHAEFADAPKEHIREALEKAIFEADANALPVGAAVKAPAAAKSETSVVAVGPAPATVIKNDVIAHAPPPVADDPDADVDMVTANVPRAFKLRLDHTTQIAYNAGAQSMPRAHAEHWYAQNHGVTIVKPHAKTATRTK